MPNELLQYDKKLAEIADKMEAIHTKADEDQDGILTDEQQTEWDALKTQRAQAQTARERAVELREQRRTAPAVRSVAGDGSGAVITDIRNRAETDPRHGFQGHREYLGAVMAAAGVRHLGDVPDERLRALAAGNGGDSVPELAFMVPCPWTPASLRATAGSDEQGGYDYGRGGAAVPVTLMPGMLQIGAEADPTVGRTTMVPMASPIVSLLARVDKDHSTSVSGGFIVTRRPETVDITSSRMEMERVDLTASGLFGLAFATEEILTDSPISFIAMIAACFGDQFAHHILSEKIRGLGGDQYLGALTALAASSLGPTIAVARTTGSTILAADALAMQARCWGYDDAIWLANHDTRPTLSTLATVVSDGGATPVGGIVATYQKSLIVGQPDMLLGRPIFYSEYPSTLGAAGDLILGNWSQFLEGLYQPLQSAESVHVRFVQHERAFKFWVRNAGAPWWRSALTPNQSTDTLSPFVILAA